jgi:signal transduction histidine kinase/CheY-like chemotaxis protein
MLPHYDHMFEAIVVMDLQKKVVHCNPAFFIFSKQPPRVLKSIEFLSQLLEAKDFDLEAWIDEGFLKLELRVSPELQLIHVREKDLFSHVVIRQFPIELPEGTFVAIAFHDLSIEKNLYDKYRQQLQELQSTHAQIIQADKLATLGEMTATISHEISNPLTIAVGTTELIDVYLEQPDITVVKNELIRANYDIRESIDRIHTIIRNMKHFLWQSEETKEFCSLGDAVSHAIEWLKAPIESGNIKVEPLFLTQDSIVLANRLKIEQVIINLVKNAIDAMVEKQTENPTVLIEVRRSSTDNFLELRIIDNGPGMPAHVKENLFRPFITTKKVGQGTGLGLSISQKIIESHEGAIELQDVSTGTCFCLRLPPIEGYSFTRGDKISRGLSTKQGPRILIVDNEPQILNVLTRFLEDQGYHVIASARPEEALRFIGKMSVDLLLTDLSMPEMNGRQVAQQARELGHKGAILYMSTSKNTEAYNRDRDKLQIDGMVIKPFSKDEVIRTVKDALGGHS